MNPQRSHPSKSLLAAVSRDLRPVRPAFSPGGRALQVVPLAVLAIVGVFLFIGLRRDTSVMGPALAWGASVAQAAFGVVLIWIATRESTPGQRPPQWIVRSSMALALLLVLGVSLWTFEARPILLPARFPAWRAAYMCGSNGTIAGLMLVGLISLLHGRRLLAARPALVGALFGAGAGIVVNSAWRLSCAISSPFHALIAHAGPILITTLAGAVLVSLMARVAWRRSS